MSNEKPVVSTIDEYIQSCPEQVRPMLHQLRDLIREAAPQATEKISWGMATFVLNGNLVHFSAEKQHIGFHPAPSAIQAFQEQLKDFHCSKGTVRLPYTQPLPEKLLREMVQFRVREQLAPPSKKKQETLCRPRCELPDDCRKALERGQLWQRYELRPPYQRNDYISWINRAKRLDTRQKRLQQMLEELKSGDAYMGMPYRAKTEKEE